MWVVSSTQALVFQMICFSFFSDGCRALMIYFNNSLVQIIICGR